MSARLARALVSTGAAALALGLVAPSTALADDGARDADRSQAADHRRNGDKPAARSGQQGASEDKGDPAGNNGTIKINTYGGPTSRANSPHPGCDFRLSLFGFDDDQTGTITFVGHAPTAGAVTKQPLSGTQTLSNDAAGGGKDVDAVFDVRGSALGLTGTPHAQQGFHIKVLVDADDAPGGAKQKVFWLDCPVPAPAAPASTVTTQTVTSEVAGTTGGAATGAVESAVESVATSAGRVSGQSKAAETFTGGSAGAAVSANTATTATAPQDRGSALPFTGVPLPALIALALATLAAGALAVRAGRRRTASDLL